MHPALEEAGGQNLELRGLGLPRAGGLRLLRDRWRELRVDRWWGADAVGEQHGAVLGHLLSSVSSKGVVSGGCGDHQECQESSGRFSVEPSTQQLVGVGEASGWTGVCWAAVAEDKGKREDKLL